MIKLFTFSILRKKTVNLRLNIFTFYNDYLVQIFIYLGETKSYNLKHVVCLNLQIFFLITLHLVESTNIFLN